LRVERERQRERDSLKTTSKVRHIQVCPGWSQFKLVGLA
jgi:hypothetical protein